MDVIFTSNVPYENKTLSLVRVFQNQSFGGTHIFLLHRTFPLKAKLKINLPGIIKFIGLVSFDEGTDIIGGAIIGGRFVGPGALDVDCEFLKTSTTPLLLERPP